jgi:hypothetical protein
MQAVADALDMGRGSWRTITRIGAQSQDFLDDFL